MIFIIKMENKTDLQEEKTIKLIHDESQVLKFEEICDTLLKNENVTDKFAVSIKIFPAMIHTIRYGSNDLHFFNKGHFISNLSSLHSSCEQSYYYGHLTEHSVSF